MRERRYKKSRTPKRVFLVLCEGETERAYIEVLKRHFRVPVTIKAKVCRGNINARLVNCYLNELGLENGDDYRVFYVYDSDVPAVVDRLKKLDGQLILTNPCIELWFLLHLKVHSGEISTSDTLRLLVASHPSWANYEKGVLTLPQVDMLTRYETACARARRLQWPANPSSNFYMFIEALVEEEKC